MAHKRLLFRFATAVVLVIGLLPVQIAPFQTATQVAQAAAATQPVVAIHVSELTEALETMPATPPTPTGTGYSGYEWFYASWHYFVIPESLKIALESDGTPYVVVTDADIVAGALMDGSAPKYPIVFSLASEAVNDSEIQPLRDYVDSGGFLFVGSSAFTRNPNGTTRGNFALADEMGLNMVNNTLQNWAFNSSFTHSTDHRLVSHIPTGTVTWDMLTNAEDIVWGSNGSQHLWQVTANGAEVIATGGSYPLIATNVYGAGRFIYHSILNPIVGAGGYDSGMYAYTIYRSAVEWAFEASNLPIVKRSPWPYAYDAAFMVRHDFENYLGAVGGTIESSAQYEQSVGAKGDYYFCTGIVRTLPTEEDKEPYIDSIRRAVSLYGATIGSHNGGYFNPDVTDPGAYDYWHWGPDTMIDRTTFGAPYESYNNNGYGFAKDSIQISFEDLEGWLAGTDNGRSGCGALGNCPRTWVSPYFNSGRDRSFNIFEELGAAVMGEQKVSPFPHWTLSYDPTNIDHRYAVVTMPPSDWYVGSGVSQSIEGHNSASIQALVDFYTQKGYLMNLYGHSGSTGGNMKTYVDDAIAKPGMWATNAVGLYDWWVARDPLVVTPSFSKTGETAIATATISGATDPQAAIELVLPYWSSGAVGNLQVLFSGVPANPSEYRTTNYGVKVRVGTTVTNVQVSYTPLEGWVQTDWSGGAGQAIWSDATRYASATNINAGVTGQVSLSLSSGGASLFSDNFNRAGDPPPTPVPFSWITSGIPGNYGVFDTIGGTLNTSLSTASQYGFAYKDVPVQPAGDYTIDADISFPYSMGAGGGGIFGRLDPATGTRYAIWIYPPTTLRLIRFPSWSGTGWANLGDATIPAVGTSSHHLKMVFNGSNIQVFYNNGTTPTHNVTDANYSTGYVGVDYWGTTTNGPSYNNYVVSDNLGNTIFSDNFGDDPTEPNLLPPWSVYTGSWSVTDYTLRSTGGGLGNYASIYYNPDPIWMDYSVQARVQYPSGAFGGGLVGRLNPTTGTRYTAWVYPGSNTLNLLEWSDWDTWASLTSAGISAVGTGWHDVTMDFSGNRIRVYWDGSLLIDTVDPTAPYLSGGIGFDSYSGSGAYLIAADDVQVTGPAQYESSGVLTSSAFDGGVGAEWYNISWNAALPTSTTLCVRTRTADTSITLASATWSGCYASSGSAVTSPDLRWMQYQVELATSDTNVTPNFSEIGITYTPGSYLPQSFLTYNGSANGDSQTTATLSATLLDESSQPVIGRTVSFSLDGIPSVSGVTNSSGIATASLALNIAPGNYPLAVAFAGDVTYAPSSASTTFMVTESWLEWIQDSEADFAGGTLSGVDTTTIPGSVTLLSQQVGEGEEYGPFTLDSGIYNYRHRIFVDNPNTSQLPGGYSLKLVVDTAALESAGKLLASGDDLRLVWTGGSTPLELDRVADTAFNTPATEIWFKTQAAISASSLDTSYYIYYNNLSAGAPPADPVNVFALYDSFDDSTINTNLWTQAGTVTESGGWAHLAAGGNLYGMQTFTYGMLEMRIQTISEGAYMWWGWEDGAADAPNFVVFEDYPSPTNLTALLRNDGAAYQTLTLTAQPAGGLALPHIYATEWRPGQARWVVDGAQVQSATIGVPDTPMSANFNANQLAFNIDWVRGRLAATLEPTVTLASTYMGYVSNGTFTSTAYNTGGTSAWHYLIWDALTPAGTSLALRLRTAQTEQGLPGSAWVDYAQTGMLITNPEARWIQYEADLSTNDASRTPELQQVTIYYSLTNQAPVATSDSYTTDEDTSLIVAAPGVLGNDSDPDSDPLTAVLVAGTSHGDLTLNSDGSFSYTPSTNYHGPDSFTYVANDGTADSNEATVSLTVNQLADDIQDMVDAASPGDTLIIPPGTYHESVLIYKPLTLQLSPAVILQPTSPAFTITAADVSILGPATLDGWTGTANNTSPAILVLAGGHNFTFKDMTVLRWADGVQVAADVTSFKLLDNFIHDNSGAGLLVDSGVSIGGVVTINGNLFKDNLGNGVQNDGDTLNLPAEYNSWGADGGPLVSPGDGVSSQVDYDPWTFSEIFLDMAPPAQATSVTVDQASSFDIALNADAQNLYGLIFRFTFDPAKLHWNSTSLSAPWNQVGRCSDLSTPLTGVIQLVCNLTIPDPAFDGGTVATLNFTALDFDPDLESWSDILDISHIPGLTSSAAIGGVKVFVNNAGFNAASIPARDISDANDGQVLVNGLANFTGFVDLQGRYNDAGALLSVYASPPIAAATPLAQASSAASGLFTSAFLSPHYLATTHTYYFQFDAPLYLPTTALAPLPPPSSLPTDWQNGALLASRPLTSLSALVLLGGDASDNNVIGIEDAACIGADYGTATSTCSPGSSDVNADGVINILDLVLMGGNYDKNSSPWGQLP